MPLYEYECERCGDRFEIIQKFSDSPLAVHADYAGSCSGAVRKLLAAPAIQFKGSGWYVTDYGKAGKKPRKERTEASGSRESRGSKDSGKTAKKNVSGKGPSASRSGNASAPAS